MTVDPIPDVPPVPASCRCDVCDRPIFGLVELVVHYEIRHPLERKVAA
jgi:hypothetical protein